MASQHGFLDTDMTDVQLNRFMRKFIVTEEGCWLWRGHLNQDGYARVAWERKLKFVHRYSYEHWVGVIPE